MHRYISTENISFQEIVIYKQTTHEQCSYFGKVSYRRIYDVQMTNKLTNARLKNATEYWKMLRDVSQHKCDISLEDFVNHFKDINNMNKTHCNLYEPEIKCTLNRYEKEEFNVMFKELDVDIMHSEVKTAIEQLKAGKSAGHDLLINEFFMSGKDILLPYLTALFNKILQTGLFPEEWAEGVIVPIHKSGNKNLVDNYRGITLLSVLGKLFTRILNNRLTEWGQRYNVYIEAQAGFRKNYSTRDQIFVLNSLINIVFNKSKDAKLYCAFVDFRKAYDLIVRDLLWYKLLKLGIRGKMFNVIKCMYSNVKSKVKHNLEISDCFDCNLGLIQGEIMSPFLFSMYINDLEETMFLKGADCITVESLKIFLLMYADDIVLFSESADGLQKNLDILKMYCAKWELTVNTKKTKVMIFQKHGRISKKHKFIYDGIELEITNAFSYLGIVFSPNGLYNKAQRQLSQQGNKAMFKLFSSVSKFRNLNPGILLDLFDKLILPILCYSCEVWGFNVGKDIERVHLRFCKYILRIKNNTLNEIVYGELGRRPLYVYRMTRIIKYWIHIMELEENRYVKCMYNVLYQRSLINVTRSWVTEVRNLLCNCGFAEVWYNQGVGYNEDFLKVVTQRIYDIYSQDWSAKLHESPSARTYILYKDALIFSKYISEIKIEKWRISLTRFRTNNHKLAIETGRWNKSPINERKCNFCLELEDEFHFLLECKLYITLRKRILPKYYWNRPNMLKFSELISTDNVKLLNLLAKYVHKAFDIRNNYVNNQVR